MNKKLTTWKNPAKICKFKTNYVVKRVANFIKPFHQNFIKYSLERSKRHIKEMFPEMFIKNLLHTSILRAFSVDNFLFRHRIPAENSNCIKFRLFHDHQTSIHQLLKLRKTFSHFMSFVGFQFQSVYTYEKDGGMKIDGEKIRSGKQICGKKKTEKFIHTTQHPTQKSQGFLPR